MAVPWSMSGTLGFYHLCIMVAIPTIFCPTVWSLPPQSQDKSPLPDLKLGSMTKNQMVEVAGMQGYTRKEDRKDDG